MDSIGPVQSDGLLAGLLLLPPMRVELFQASKVFLVLTELGQQAYISCTCGVASCLVG